MGAAPLRLQCTGVDLLLRFLFRVRIATATLPYFSKLRLHQKMMVMAINLASTALRHGQVVALTSSQQPKVFQDP